jgi:aminopeptidase-like protein
MMQILKRIDGLAIAPVAADTDKQNQILKKELPFKVSEYKSGSQHNGWYVPDRWQVIKGTISRNGKLIYDGAMHPLGVVGYSKSFKGKVNLSELKKHLFYKEDAPDNIVYHCDYYYKPSLRDWGFSMPYDLYKTLKPCKYDIDLEVKSEPGTMKVLEYNKKGQLGDTIVFNAHNCHAAQLNDGPAGYVVFMEVMKRLKKMKTKYSYQLVIAPEHIGTVFHLASKSEKEIAKYKYGIFMEMVGHDNPIFSLQESFNGDSLIDKIAHHVLKFKSQGYWSDSYRKVVGNDESVWEAAGYEVPMIGLFRTKRGQSYPEYHLDSDNIKIMKADKLRETVDIILSIVSILEKNCYLKRKFTGLVSLSNPKYNLYITPGTDPSYSPSDQLDSRANWYELMDRLPRYMDGSMSILDIAIKHDLAFDLVYDYILKFKRKGLVEFI